MLDEHVDLIDGPEVETRELSIPTDLHGERLDRALAVLLPEFSRSYSQQLLSEGCVSCVLPVPRVMTKASAKVRMGGSKIEEIPGIGPRSAERIALWLLRSPQSPSADLAKALTAASAGIQLCPSCGFFASLAAGCILCDNPARDLSVICVIEQATDILPLERTGAFKGHYHSLHGRLSPLDNIGPEDLRIAALLQRLRGGPVREIILATGSDVEGEATANYLAELLRGRNCKLTRIAQGLPAGGGLEHADGGHRRQGSHRPIIRPAYLNGNAFSWREAPYARYAYRTFSAKGAPP